MNKKVSYLFLVALATFTTVAGSAAVMNSPAKAGWAPWVQVFVTDYPEGNGRDYWENVRVCQNKAKENGRPERVKRWWVNSTFRDGKCWTRVPIWE